MAIVTEYKCIDCGIELKDDGRVFIWDGESHETRDFLILMRTCEWLNGAKISGRVNETYCSECKKFLKIYSICEAAEDIENPRETVMEGIERHIDLLGGELQRLKDIRKKSEYTIEKKDYYYIFKIPEYPDFFYSSYLLPHMTKDEVIKDALNDFHEQIDEVIESRQEMYDKFLNANYLVVEEDGWKDIDLSDKEKCPECGKEIFKYVNGNNPCPKCGGRLCPVSQICYD